MQLYRFPFGIVKSVNSCKFLSRPYQINRRLQCEYFCDTGIPYALLRLFPPLSTLLIT